MKKTVYFNLLISTLFLLTQFVSADDDGDVNYKLWATSITDDACPIDQKRMIQRLFLYKQSKSDVSIELWIDGQPKGLTLRSEVTTRYLAEQGLCSIIVSSKIVDYEEAGGISRPIEMSVYRRAGPSHIVTQLGDVYITGKALDEVVFQLNFMLRSHF